MELKNDPAEHPGSAISTIPPSLLLKAYSIGMFPMAHDDGELYWHDPDPRAIFPLNSIQPDRKTARQLRSDRYTISRDEAFIEVIEACAQREETWIDDRIIRSYIRLHELGYAHSVEVWREEQLVGGIYGVSIGGAFFGESMFNRIPNAGKIAFHALVDHLKRRGFQLFDTQYINPFTEQLGAVEIGRAAYKRTLAKSLALAVEF